MAPRRPTTTTIKRAPAEDAINTDREVLLSTLGRLKPALRTGGAILELGHVWFSDGYVCAYDGGMGIRVPLASGLSCGAPGRPLLGLLGTSVLKQVLIEQDDDGVMVRFGKSRTRLNVLALDRNPWPFPLEHEGSPAKFSAAVVAALQAVLVVKPSPATRLEHHGIAMYCTGATIDFYATDSRTLAQTTHSEKGTGLPKFMFLPRPLAEQIVALCPQGAEIYATSDYIVALGQDVEVYSNVLDTAGLTDLPALVRRKHDPHPDPVALPAGLEAVLDRADVLAGSGDSAVVRMSVRGRRLTLSGAGKLQHGEMHEDLTLEGEHPDVEINVVASMLRRGVLVSDSLSIAKDSVAFYGGDNFLFLVAAHS